MHIKSVSTFNLFGSSGSRTIELSSPVVILTGYNGAGKSTLLGVVHSALSVAKGQEYSFPKTNWGCKVEYAAGGEFMHVKTSRVLPDNFAPPHLTAKKIKDRDALKVFYESVQKTFDEKVPKTTVIIKREGEGRDALSTNVMAIKPPSDDGMTRWPSSILYGDETFSSQAEDLETTKFEGLDIFSKKKTLDKTFFLLQSEFASEANLNDSGSAASELIRVIDQTIRVMETLGAADDDNLREQITALEKIRESRLGANPLIKQANIFFESTKREVKIKANGFLYMVTSHGEVSWYDFSKGEKTLLCLLLVAYLSRKENMVFLLDEPDLSLHIRWQRQLLSSLRKLAPVAQFIVATHSPALVGQTDEEAVINLGAISKG